MKTALLIGTALMSQTLATPSPSTWNKTPLAVTSTNSACQFKPIAELFEFTGQISDDCNGGCMTEKTTFAGRQEWIAMLANPSVKFNKPLAKYKITTIIAKFDTTATYQGTSNNYKYYKRHVPVGTSTAAWTVENNPVQEFTICVQVTGSNQCTTQAGNLHQIINVPLTTTETFVDNVGQVISLATQKIVGVESKCGNAETSKYAKSTTTGENIFAWADFRTTGQITYNVDYTRNIGYDASNTVDGDASYAVPHNGDSFDDEITLSISLSENLKVHDLLYVLGDKSPNAQALTLSSAPEKVHIEFPDWKEVVGDLVIQNDASGTGHTEQGYTCSAVLGIESPDGKYHCFDGTSPVQPNAVVDAANDPNVKFGSVTTTIPYNYAKKCKAKIDVTCVYDPLHLTYTDTRACTSDGDGTEDCADLPTVNWSATAQFQVNSAIIEAVRLRDARAYPFTDMSGDAKVTNNFNGFTTHTHATTSNVWKCKDSGCAATDPYVILGANVGTVSTTCSFTESRTDPAPSNVNISAQAIGCDGATTTTTGTVPTVKIQLPPEQFPQFYVYGIVEYRAVSPYTNTAVYGHNTDASAGQTTDGSASSRRLGTVSQRLGTASTFGFTPIDKTLIVRAADSMMSA